MTVTFPTVDNILSALATLEGGITGIVKAFADAPETLTSADCPAFINLPGVSSVVPNGYDELGHEFIETRDYYCILIVAPVGLGVSGEKFGEVTPLIAPCRNAFSSVESLGKNAFSASFKGDTGVRGDINYGGSLFYGCRFTLQVVSLYRVDHYDKD